MDEITECRQLHLAESIEARALLPLISDLDLPLKTSIAKLAESVAILTGPIPRRGADGKVTPESKAYCERVIKEALER